MTTKLSNFNISLFEKSAFQLFNPYLWSLKHVLLFYQFNFNVHLPRTYLKAINFIIFCKKNILTRDGLCLYRLVRVQEWCQ